MFLRLKDNNSNDYMVAVKQGFGEVVFFGDNEKNEFNVVVNIDKQKTIELIEFLQECVKEMK